jgi:hypothetical protein
MSISTPPFVHPQANSLAPTGRIFMKFDIILRKSVQKIRVPLKSEKNNRYFTWRPITIFFITSRSVLLTMRNVSYKSCTENQNTHLVFNNFFLENRTVYEKMWENFVEWGSPQMTISYGVCALHAGFLRLQTHTQSM